MSIVDPGNIECDLQSGALAGFKVNINSSLIPSFGLPGGSGSKESVCNEEDTGLIPGSGRSPGERNGNPLHYPCLGNPRTEEPGRLQSMGMQKSWTKWQQILLEDKNIYTVFLEIITIIINH